MKMIISNPNKMTGDGTSIQDLPKIQLAPKPTDPIIWTAYTADGRLRARLHIPGKFNEMWFDGELSNPEYFVEVCLAYGAGK